MTTPISEAELHAYADNRLDPSRRTRVEAWLAAHPEQREQVDTWRRQAAQLHRAYDAMLDAPVPQRLIPPANDARGVAWRRLAAVAWLMIGALAGYLLRGEVAPPPSAPIAGDTLPRMAAVAHAVYTPEVRHPVEVGADQQAHLIAWLSKRLGAPLKAPQLDDAGFHLVGGRLLPGARGEVAQFMYEDATQQRLTLYVQPNAAHTGETRFRHAREDGIDVFYWIDGPFGYALSGTVGRDKMLQLATLVYRQIGP
ncbi:anti-sigma factor [Nitrogeniibacter mangrovi]|uniref:Anti-sigma factor n=2 Tax=Nitrogeniibacter mangrovi TaxID=2016596 RepID=A0A6C1B857_9RHOO|nr:anti-sigma factor [Nitrogeniibacter mangrovi]